MRERLFVCNAKITTFWVLFLLLFFIFWKKIIFFVFFFIFYVLARAMLLLSRFFLLIIIFAFHNSILKKNHSQTLSQCLPADILCYLELSGFRSLSQKTHGDTVDILQILILINIHPVNSSISTIKLVLSNYY